MVLYQDIGPKFLDEQGGLSKDIMPDRLHPNDRLPHLGRGDRAHGGENRRTEVKPTCQASPLECGDPSPLYGAEPQQQKAAMNRRTPKPRLLALAVALLAGCQPAGPGSLPDAVWGRHGVSEGRFEKPRAMAIDGSQRIFIVDMTARIQAFDLEGHYLFGWQTPEHEHGKPTGLSIARNGDIWVADTHYYRLLRYSPRAS